jgi:hypothetical protein
VAKPRSVHRVRYERPPTRHALHLSAGSARLDPALLDEAIRLRLEQPARSAAHISEIVRARHGVRWALIEAATHAARDPRYLERYERTKQRLGRQRGAKVARVDLARQLAEAIWHVLTKNEPFHPAGPAIRLVA